MLQPACWAHLPAAVISQSVWKQLCVKFYLFAAWKGKQALFLEKNINKLKKIEINMREFHGYKSEEVEKQPGAACLCAASAT